MARCWCASRMDPGARHGVADLAGLLALKWRLVTGSAGAGPGRGRRPQPIQLPGDGLYPVATIAIAASPTAGRVAHAPLLRCTGRTGLGSGWGSIPARRTVAPSTRGSVGRPDRPLSSLLACWSSPRPDSVALRAALSARLPRRPPGRVASSGAPTSAGVGARSCLLLAGLRWATPICLATSPGRRRVGDGTNSSRSVFFVVSPRPWSRGRVRADAARLGSPPTSRRCRGGCSSRAGSGAWGAT